MSDSKKKNKVDTKKRNKRQNDWNNKHYIRFNIFLDKEKDKDIIDYLRNSSMDLREILRNWYNVFYHK